MIKDEEEDEEVLPIERGRRTIEKLGVDEERKEEERWWKRILRNAVLYTLGSFFESVCFGGEERERLVFPSLIEDQGAEECTTCFESYNTLDFVNCKKNHKICISCVRNIAKRCERNAEVVCPFLNCKSAYWANDLQQCLSVKELKRLKRGETEFDKMIGVENDVAAIYCQCGFVGIVENATVGDNTVTCKCGETYCIKCGYFAHSGSLCPTPSGTTNKEWIAKNTKPCPNCKKPIEKAGGCNHMRCSRCKHQFCWMCTREWGSRCGCLLF